MEIPTEQDATRLAIENAEEEPSIVESYWFPDEHEIRLVHLDMETLASEGTVQFFYFSADPAHGVKYPSRIALVQPAEFRKLKLPSGWTGWDEARLIYKRRQTA